MRRGTAGMHQTVETCAGGGLLSKYSKHFSSQFCINKTFVQISTSSPSSPSNPKNSHNASFAFLCSFANIAKMRFKRRHIPKFCGCNFNKLNKSVSEFCGSGKIAEALAGKATPPVNWGGVGDANGGTDGIEEVSRLSCPQSCCCAKTISRSAILHHRYDYATKHHPCKHPAISPSWQISLS